MLTYTQTTSGVTVSVQSYFLEDRSNILQKSFFFVYFIGIENSGPGTVRLLRRHWYIHDSTGNDYEVEGEGVVGEQPSIDAGGQYQYNSFCILKSFEGSMEGTYTFEREDGSTFEAAIPLFHLRARLN